MKKILTSLIIISSFLYADQIRECKETKLTETTSIFACPSGDYEATFELRSKKRDMAEAPKLKLLGKREPNIINNYNQK
ncbi:hypothetical protein [Poseidonibacter ostreae]|jgi:hypothetical protein|uniref:Uncharacterized protein n=1 Tax=Poseidonibacter ostreae TaxID=2654171 RepID=A0A6L4WQS4_9BACT|nr:hypothetical protein [Poseidonibacter ostreae]KAB7887260.1 hypothetical protein GBG19_11015 [Poseidonibacter ostreae]KAB7888320.1 hypothetical protein GA417_00655 [Poseidonibacter ostreae]KAB7889531.1 hypothetical protein GBG18_10920 [Poseidonibacter ostreae]MAC82926.1 hypothetical protein [Arcobacter sp.]|tara:strand:+ start:8775 stop:9011 length:237 start_codon:yes stop_codon:yes gene_type:complete